QNQVYTAEFSNVSKEDFERLKGLFTSDPGSVNDNKLATYQLVDMDGDGVVSVNDHVDIDIYGPDNGSVVVQDVAANATGFVAKFATLEGHTDAGWIYFGAFYDEKTQTLTYTINNTTRTNTDMTLVLGIPLAVSRGAQQNQWKRVLGNVARILNGNLTSASMTITEYDYSDSTNTMSTVPEWTKQVTLKVRLLSIQNDDCYRLIYLNLFSASVKRFIHLLAEMEVVCSFSFFLAHHPYLLVWGDRKRDKQRSWRILLPE
ncbi:MAG TPA: hypothetical protein VGD31_14580, partial [Sphingobacteriaceae bacterium]